ncbi:MAG: hypothetical protein QHC90_13350 [Shinella sp.]|nr:hypothetical protein [Shinella sp.]
MSNDFSIEYEFEEIPLAGDGLMAWGTAILVHDGDGEFYVDEIILHGGKRLDRHGTGHWGFPSAVNKALFNALALHIEMSNDAQETFAEAYREQNEGDPDRLHDERRDHQAMGWL